MGSQRIRLNWVTFTFTFNVCRHCSNKGYSFDYETFLLHTLLVNCCKIISHFVANHLTHKSVNFKFIYHKQHAQGFTGGSDGKRHKRRGFVSQSGKIPWRKAWQPPPVFLLEKFHGQRSLVGYNPWDSKELDTTERMSIYIVFVLLTTFYRYRFLVIVFPLLENTICVLTGKSCH